MGFRLCHVWLVVLVVAFGVIVWKNAWLCDDAYISFRSVENLVGGHGLVWNPGERVQTFTNPLWTLALSGLRVFTGELYYTTLIISILLSVLAVAVLVWQASSFWLGAAAVVALLASRSFTDFSTSGLENPLGHLLIVLFVLAIRGRDGSLRGLFVAAVCAGLATWNRMDAVLLFLPLLALIAWRQPKGRAVLVLLAGFAPFLLWEVFALVYYGFPFPNTAYAKLGAGVSSGTLLEQGLAYLRHSLANDPATLVAVALAAVLFLRERSAVALAACAGLVLSLAYVLRAGGDFMSGRFLAAPLVFAVAWAATTTRPPSRRVPLVGAPLLFLLAAFTPHSHLWSDADYGADESHRANAGFINIERAFYFQTTGLALRHDPERFLQHPWIAEGKGLAAQAPVVDGILVRVTGAIGFVGYFAGPDVRVYDIFALSDALLARLPAGAGVAADTVAIGHFARLIPLGFVEARRTGAPLGDPALERADRALHSVTTTEPLFTRERWQAIRSLNRGGLDATLREYLEREPVRTTRAALDGEEGTPITRNGLDVVLATVTRAPRVELGCDLGSIYEVRFFLDGEQLGSMQAPPSGTQQRTVETPPRAIEQGFDRVRLVPLFGFGEYRLRSLEPLP